MKLQRRSMLRGLGWALLAAALVLGSAPNGQAGFYDRENGTCSAAGLDQLDLKSLFRDLARELCADSCEECGDRKSCGGSPGESSREGRPAVLVADFVDLKTLKPGAEGMLMGELMRGSLSAGCCYRIIQAEFSRYFRLTESGLAVLSRDVREIKFDSVSETECVVGTYSLLNNKIILFVRRINVATGKITRMATREIDLDCHNGAVSYRVR